MLKYCVEIKWSVILCLDELAQRINMILSYSMAKTVNSLRSNIQFYSLVNHSLFISFMYLYLKNIKNAIQIKSKEREYVACQNFFTCAQKKADAQEKCKTLKVI
jgi:hypothetical protein